jgi:hypothetical protein
MNVEFLLAVLAAVGFSRESFPSGISGALAEMRE